MLGLTSPEETQQVEALAAGHAAIRDEIAAIQAALETYATKQAQLPPPSLKNKVMAALDELQAEEQKTIANPFISIERTGYDESTDQENTTEFIIDEEPGFDNSGDTIPLNSKKPKRHNYWMVAASILLILSLAGNLFLYHRWKSTQSELAQATAEQGQLARQNRDMQHKMQVATLTASVVSNPDYRVVNLQTNDPKINAEVVLYWHPQKGNLYVAASKLPPLPAGKKYQLWAIVGGKPLDAGIFAPQPQDGLLTMKAMPMQAQAFAITMEDESGSATPTMPIYVQGSV